MPEITLDTLLWWTLKGSVITVIAFASSVALRRGPAAVRHAIWSVAVLTQLLLPFSGSLVPRQTLEVRLPLRSIDALAAAPAPPPEPAAGTPAPAADTTRPAERTELRPMQLLPFLLAAGGILLFLRLLGGTLRVTRIAARAERVVEGEWLELLQRHCIELRLARPVTLLWSDAVPGPVTWGFFYPVVLLPRAAKGWPDALRRHVLVHELAHVRRGDALTQLAAQLALTLFWFNPLLWLAVRAMRNEAENACDDYVLRDGERPSVYATTLVRLIEAHRGASLPAFASLGVARRSELEKRISAITSPGRDPSMRKTLLVSAVTAMLVIVLPLSAIQRSAPGSDPTAVASESKGQIACTPLEGIDFTFGEMSGTLTRDGVTRHYFFLRPRADRCIESSFSLDARFTADDRDLDVTPGLRAIVHEKVGVLDRAVRIAESNGRLTYRYSVNGEARAWDENAQAWYHATLPEFVRLTTAGVMDRARRIVELEGVAGLRAELQAISNSSVRAEYLTALLSLRSASALPRREVIAMAETLRGHEPELANFLATIIRREGARAEVRAEVLAATATLADEADRKTVLDAMLHHRDSSVKLVALHSIDLLGDDIWKRTLLQENAPGCLRADNALADAYFEAMEHLAADEKRVLLAELIAIDLDPAVAGRVSRAAQAADVPSNDS